MDAKQWIVVGATSVLGLGLTAAGATGVAAAMPLIAQNFAVVEDTPIDLVNDEANLEEAKITVSDSLVSDDTTSTDQTSVISVSSDSPASPVSVSPVSPVSVNSDED